MTNTSIRHCFSCGNFATLRFVEGRERHICSGCELVLYANPSPAAAVLLIKEEHILLVKRGMEPQKGCWALPAGYQEVDETPEAAARREMQEETGLIPGKLQLFDLIYSDFNPHKPVNLAVYKAENAEGTLTPGDDVLEAGFFPLNQLPQHETFDYIHGYLKNLSRPLL